MKCRLGELTQTNIHTGPMELSVAALAIGKITGVKIRCGACGDVSLFPLDSAQAESAATVEGRLPGATIMELIFNSAEGSLISSQQRIPD